MSLYLGDTLIASGNGGSISVTKTALYSGSLSAGSTADPAVLTSTIDNFDFIQISQYGTTDTVSRCVAFVSVAEIIDQLENNSDNIAYVWGVNGDSANTLNSGVIKFLSASTVKSRAGILYVTISGLKINIT